MTSLSDKKEETFVPYACTEALRESVKSHDNQHNCYTRQ